MRNQSANLTYQRSLTFIYLMAVNEGTLWDYMSSEKGGKKGTILIHYAYEGLDNEGKEWIFESERAENGQNFVPNGTKIVGRMNQKRPFKGYFIPNYPKNGTFVTN